MRRNVRKRSFVQKIKNHLGTWFKEHPNAIYIIIVILMLLIIIPIMYIILKPSPPDEIKPIKTEKPGPLKPYTVEEKEKKMPQYPDPESRDRYVHIETVPGDGLYEIIQESDTEGLPEIEEPLLALAGYIKKIEECEKITLISNITSGNTRTVWLCCDDLYWRLKQCSEDERLTADGALRDFWYEPVENWDSIYSEIPENMLDIDITLVAAMTASIMEQYPYQEYLGQHGSWYWDKDDYNNKSLLTYIFTLQNEHFTDDWVIEYYPNRYICAYRNIVGGGYNASE